MLQVLSLCSTLCKLCELYTYHSYHLYLCTYTHMYVLFPIWCPALLHTDWQSNALTQIICNMVTSLMAVTCYVVTCCMCLHTHSTQVSVWTSLYTFINTCYFANVWHIKLHVHVSIATTCVCFKRTYILL